MPEDVSLSIDGPTASGKTTLARHVAHRLNASFLDTGLTFRAVAYLSTKMSIELQGAWQHLLRHAPSRYELDADGELSLNPSGLYFQDTDISDAIFARELDTPLRKVAKDPSWRKEIQAYHQQLIAGMGSCVVVGRDVATTLLPEASLKVALMASWPIRRERRRAQYRNMSARSAAVGEETDLDVAMRQIIANSANSLVLDTTYLPPAAVVSAVFHRLEAPK